MEALCAPLLRSDSCHCIDVSRTIRKINCFCFYISIVTQAKELEKNKQTLGSQDLHCPQVSIYRAFPHPMGRSAGNLHQRGNAEGLYTELPLQIQGFCTLNKQKHRQKYRNIEGILIVSQTTQRLQSFGHVLSSWDRFLLRFRGRKELKKEGPNPTASGASGTQIWPHG